MTGFDTLKAAKPPRDAGFEARQAEAMVDMVTHALTGGPATGEDARELKAGMNRRLAALDSRIGTGLAALHVKIDNGLAALDARIDALDTRIDAGLNDVTQKLTIRLGGIVAGGIAVLEVLNRIFPVVPAP